MSGYLRSSWTCSVECVCGLVMELKSLTWAAEETRYFDCPECARKLRVVFKGGGAKLTHLERPQ